MPSLIAHRVASRWKEAAKPTLEVFKSGDEIAVNMGVDDVGEVGYLLFNKIGSTGHRLRGCEDNVAALQKKVFGKKQVPVYYVSGADLEPEYQGKGWGTKMYQKALRAAKPAILITGGCVGMGTTSEAMRVWKSLAKTYPSMGKGPMDSVLAVK